MTEVMSAEPSIEVDVDEEGMVHDWCNCPICNGINETRAPKEFTGHEHFECAKCHAPIVITFVEGSFLSVESAKGAHAAEPDDIHLMSCLHCGGEASIVTYKQGTSPTGTPFWRGFAKCKTDRCGMSTPMLKSPHIAAKVWNRRPGDPL
jgi:hypothetical protein